MHRNGMTAVAPASSSTVMPSAHDGREEARRRRRDELERVFGGVIGEALADPRVTDLLVNPDGAIYVDRHFEGLVRLPERLSAAAIDNAIITAASALGVTVDEQSPVLQGELPLDGSRLHALIPPCVPGPMLVIRKHRRQGVDDVPALVLDDYLRDKLIPPNYIEPLRAAVLDRENVIIAGSTSSGKTTLGGAYLNLITELAPNDRIITIEDTYELYCVAQNRVALRESRARSMRQLLKDALRLRPDRIIFGEVRDAAAHDLIMAWNTGHNGGFCTVHANSVRDAFGRLEALVQQAEVPVVPKSIASAIQLIVGMQREPTGLHRRRVTELAYVRGVSGDEYTLEHVAPEW